MDTSARLEAALKAAAFQPPELEELARTLGSTEGALGPVVEMLVDAGRLVPLERGLYLVEPCAVRARQAVRENCERNGQLEIPELRDALGTSRKFLIPLLEYVDSLGLTVLRGGVRRLLPSSAISRELAAERA